MIEDRDAVAHRQRFLLVVGDIEEGDADLGLDALELGLHLLAELEIERAERLVEQQHRRPVDDRARQADALALAAGELCRPALAVRLEPHHAQRLLHPHGDLGARHARAIPGRRRCSRRPSCVDAEPRPR